MDCTLDHAVAVSVAVVLPEPDPTSALPDDPFVLVSVLDRTPTVRPAPIRPADWHRQCRGAATRLRVHPEVVATRLEDRKRNSINMSNVI